MSTATDSSDTRKIDGQPTKKGNRKPRRDVGPRQRVTVACQACRHRRAKCDGQSPCGRCNQLDLDCTYPDDLDGRSKAAAKRKFGQVQQDQDLLYALLGTIRDSSDTDVAQIVALIRSNASVDEVRAAVQQQSVDLERSGRHPSPELESLHYEMNRMAAATEQNPSSDIRSDKLQIHKIADSPLHQVPATPWTMVTDDAALVSHLLSLWLTWEKPLLNFMHHDFFVDDMKKGNLECYYCSPFLVNSMMASVCPQSIYKEVRCTRGAISKLMANFISEAKRHLEVEIAKGPSLTTVQGLLFLFISVSSAGQDRPAYQYLLQTVDMAHQLSQLPIPESIIKDDKEVAKYSEAINAACWGAFNTISSAHMVFKQPFTMKVPALPRPVFRIPDSTGVLVMTPQEHAGPPPVSFETQLMNAQCDVCVSAATLTRLLFDIDGKESLSRAEMEEKVLRLHHSVLSAQKDKFLTLIPYSSLSLCGYKLLLEMTLLTMSLFLKQPANDASREIQQMAREQCLSSALEITRVCDTYMHIYGTAMMSSFFAHCASMALYVFFEQPSTSSYDSQITSLCICLRAVSRRTAGIMAVFRMVQLEARRAGVNLPAETDKLFEDFEKDVWNQRQTRSIVSLYPSPDSITFRREGALDMGKFLEQMENLEVGDTKGTEQEQEHAKRPHK